MVTHLDRELVTRRERLESGTFCEMVPTLELKPE